MSDLLIFNDTFKAIDIAKWFNTTRRTLGYEWIIVPFNKNQYKVIEFPQNRKKPKAFLDIVPKNYEKMSFEHIAHLAQDFDPPSHFEDILGMFSILNNQVLLFILNEKIPLEKFARNQIVSRGYDENNLWVGYDKAKKIWLK